VDATHETNNESRPMLCIPTYLKTSQYMKLSLITLPMRSRKQSSAAAISMSQISHIHLISLYNDEIDIDNDSQLSIAPSTYFDFGERFKNAYTELDNTPAGVQAGKPYQEFMPKFKELLKAGGHDDDEMKALHEPSWRKPPEQKHCFVLKTLFLCATAILCSRDNAWRAKKQTRPHPVSDGCGDLSRSFVGRPFHF
jgi:hypothetical protein